MAGDLDKDDRAMFRQMLIVDAIRGHHSTGVASATSKRETKVFKKALSPLDFMQMRQYDDVVNWDSQVLMGHNRYATVGKINHATAHPFEHGGLIGAHNGTLKGWQALPDSRDFTVDSECLIHNISKNGWKDTIPKVVGAYALTTYCEETHVLSMLRNKERPLYFALKKGAEAVYWASEAWMIRNMAARCGIELDGQIMAVKENTLVQFTLPDVKIGGVLTEPKITKLYGGEEKKYIPPANVQYPTTYNQRAAASRSNGGTNGQVGGRASYSPDSTSPVGVVINETIRWVPVCIQKSFTSGTPFVEGVMSSHPYLTVRCYIHNTLHAEEVVRNWKEIESKVSAVSPINRPTKGDEAYCVVPSASMVRKGLVIEDKDIPFEEEEINVYTNGPGKQLLNRTEFAAKTKNGCGYCSSDLDFDDLIEWYGDDPICEACVPDIMNNGYTKH